MLNPYDAREIFERLIFPDGESYELGFMLKPLGRDHPKYLRSEPVLIGDINYEGRTCSLTKFNLRAEEELKKANEDGRKIPSYKVLETFKTMKVPFEKVWNLNF